MADPKKPETAKPAADAAAKPKRRPDTELQVIGRIGRMLDTLTYDQRVRVSDYINARVHEERAANATPKQAIAPSAN